MARLSIFSLYWHRYVRDRNNSRHSSERKPKSDADLIANAMLAPSSTSQFYRWKAPIQIA
jgi:hypothetical protein